MYNVSLGYSTWNLQMLLMLLTCCCFGFKTTLAMPVTIDQQQQDVLQTFPKQSPVGGGIIGAIGTALVPVFGALLSNLAAGIATTFNNGIAAGANGNLNLNNNNRPRLPTIDAYFTHLPGSGTPYVLLTEQHVADLSKNAEKLLNPVPDENSTDHLNNQRLLNAFNQEHTGLESTESRINNRHAHLEHLN